MKYLFNACFCFIFAGCFIQAAENETKNALPAEIPKEELVETSHTIKLQGEVLNYKAAVGVIHLKDEKGKETAKVFYTAYTKEKSVSKMRPVTFCFNGGPGSSSVWLHLGAFGPKRLLISEKETPAPPYELVDNAYSLLKETDLVFIDPVSTGFSRAFPGTEAKQFHGFEADIKAMAQFIRIYVSRNGRWDSVKFLAGESYGTTRAAALASHLQDKEGMCLNGVILVSSILNFQTLIDSQRGNDLPYILFLPSYTAAAWYYQKLPDDLQNNFKKALEESEQFALNDYAKALIHGDLETKEARDEVAKKLSRYTGLSQDFIDRANLRVGSLHFIKELLKGEKKTIGRFDARMQGKDFDGCGQYFEYDPSLTAFLGPFTGAFNQYVRTDLKWKSDEPYEVLANVQPWNYDNANNCYVNAAEDLRDVMCKNKSLFVFAACGYFDLATPYFGTIYTFNHMHLDSDQKKNVKIEYYDGGHMMFLSPGVLQKLNQDILQFVQKASGNHS